MIKITHTVESITKLLATNDFAVERALIRLYELQTSSEQSSEMTHEKNHQGFSAFDAMIFTPFAKQIIANRGGRPAGCRLSPKQFNICRKENKFVKMKIAKYAKQLCEMANA